MKFVFEQTLEFETEDNGQAMIASVDNQIQPALQEPDGLFADGLFVRIQSWSKKKIHVEAASLEGKKVRVTIETIED